MAVTRRATEEETERLQEQLAVATRKLAWLNALEAAHLAWVPVAEEAKRLSDKRIRTIRDALNAPPNERPSHREVSERVGGLTNARLQTIKNGLTTAAARRRET